MPIKQPAKVGPSKAPKSDKKSKCAKCDDKGFVILRMNDGGPGAVNCTCDTWGK